MPALQVKDCPSEVYEALRVRAASENRSITQQALTLLEEGLGLRSRMIDRRLDRSPLYYDGSFPSERPHENLVEERKALFAELDSLPPIALPSEYESVADLVADCRDER